MDRQTAPWATFHMQQGICSRLSAAACTAADFAKMRYRGEAGVQQGGFGASSSSPGQAGLETC